jgi:antitoxin VapB
MEAITLDTAKVFTNGHSQAIRLPKDYRVQDSEVFVKKYEDMVLLIPKNSVWSTFMSGLNRFSDDFLVERDQPEHQDRDQIQ